MILSAQTIRKYGIVTPFCERTVIHGMSFGLSSCGYDIRIAQDEMMFRQNFFLASSIEHFEMPDNVVGRVCDKSTLVRKGLSVHNTIIEPSWRGYLTLELYYTGLPPLFLRAGQPIAQVLFEFLDEPTEQPYSGKYQDQIAEPVEAKDEK